MTRSKAYKATRAGYCYGFACAGVLLGTLLSTWKQPGSSMAAQLEAPAFSVAMLAAEKMTAIEAPENVEATLTTETVDVVDSPVAPIVVSERYSSAPDAVLDAKPKVPSSSQPEPKPEKPKVEAPKSMPGGRLVERDSGFGDDAMDPFAVQARQVFIRLQLDSLGHVIFAKVVRSGGDAVRDQMILRAMKSRVFDPSTLTIKVVENDQQIWQLDMTIPYGNNEILP